MGALPCEDVVLACRDASAVGGWYGNIYDRVGEVGRPVVRGINKTSGSDMKLTGKVASRNVPNTILRWSCPLPLFPSCIPAAVIFAQAGLWRVIRKGGTKKWVCRTGVERGHIDIMEAVDDANCFGVKAIQRQCMRAFTGLTSMQ